VASLEQRQTVALEKIAKALEKLASCVGESAAGEPQVEVKVEGK
jgi:hypothetical protein